MAGNDVANVNRAQTAVSNLAAGVNSIYSTIAGETREEKVQILEAVTNAEPVGDHLGEVIKLRHVIAQATQVEDANTKEMRDAVRTVIIDDEGKAYAAVSDGMLMALQNIFGIMGNPSTWAEPLPITVVEVKGRKGFKFFTVRIAQPE